MEQQFIRSMILPFENNQTKVHVDLSAEATILDVQLVAGKVCMWVQESPKGATLSREIYRMPDGTEVNGYMDTEHSDHLKTIKHQHGMFHYYMPHRYKMPERRTV